jgi:alpha-L-rhamnosidase
MLEKMAGILGVKDDSEKYEALSEKIKSAYNDNFFDAGSGICAPGTQSSQSFALFSDILPEDKRLAAMKYLLDDISKHDNHLTTGIFGTRYMLELLSQEGFNQTAYDIVNQKTFPGWGHMLENGATTLWEHWKFSDNTYSHNHPMFGSVSQWFYNWLGGIQPHPDAVGFDRIIIRPQIPDDLQWVNCSYNSVRGRITSNWRKTGDSLIMDIEIPVSTTATVYLPYKNNTEIRNIKSGKYQFVLPYKL